MILENKQKSFFNILLVESLKIIIRNRLLSIFLGIMCCIIIFLIFPIENWKKIISAILSDIN